MGLNISQMLQMQQVVGAIYDTILVRQNSTNFLK